MSNRQSHLDLDSELLAEAVRSVLKAEGFTHATISLAVVDDKTIHGLNRQFLSHDYPTDVLSFLLSDEDGCVEGEVVVSAETAISSALDYDWPVLNELALYVIHGTLHLAGYDDHNWEDRRTMREQESRHLRKLGMTPPRGHAVVEQAVDDPQTVEGADTQ